MKNRICIFPSLLAGCLLGLFALFTLAPPGEAADPPISGNRACDASQYRVLDTDQRAKAPDPDEYFCREREMIRKRRGLNGLESNNKDHVGLAFSGGGIRSNAFQLGFLSGLHEIKFLKKVDYISAVSGGSWAAGAYKASEKDDKTFFRDLNESVLLKDLSTNDKSIRPLFNSYERTLKDIVADKKDVLSLRVGSGSQEEWRKMLRTNVLEGKDILLRNLDSTDCRAKRPFIIFNATHDASFPLSGDKIPMLGNFPFEITSLSIGTLADCGNTSGYCSSDKRDFRNAKGVFISTAGDKLTPLYLSYAMAMSGAVVPPRASIFKLDVLQWKLEIPPIDPSNNLHREEMIITDGGHSENLGALALMERQVPRIIISDITHDPKSGDDDFDALFQHAEKLLGMKIVKIEVNEEIHVYRYYWKKPWDPVDTDKPIGTIIQVQPKAYKTKDGFQTYLLKDDTSYLRTYLDMVLVQHGLKFPTDKTYATSYEHELILCYYLLGRYFAGKIEPRLISENWHSKER